jgi:nitrous oxidase accessory protein NosD
MIAAALPLACTLLTADPIVVAGDDVEITRSATIRIAADAIADANGDGVIHVTGDGVHLRFEEGAVLRGAAADGAPDTFTGTGIRVTGRDVTIEGATIAGFKVGVRAEAADGLVVRDVTFTDMYRQRLRSTPAAEDVGDWLAPHDNDDGEWIRRYGAAVAVARSRGVTITGVRARRGQNGIVLDRVEDARIYDNDCSFLSGWGLAAWRSSRNVISRNAFDFCIRGYSHGVYNRGQDSAGILFFEQCSANVVAENSATHGGDGFFGFAGREALGERDPRDDRAWYARRGCNDNLLVRNDFSYAAAHGIEMTFSFGNLFEDNRLVGNAICGVWGGYAQDTMIVGNTIEENGALGYGLERGGVNIEHGDGNRITGNAFRRNRCGVHLWFDEDETLLALPWAEANHEPRGRTYIEDNTFEGDDVAVHLRELGGATHIHGNTMVDVGRRLRTDTRSVVTTVTRMPAVAPRPLTAVPGSTRPVGARAHLAGRERIVMTTWGPYAWDAPRLVCDGAGIDADGRPYLGYRLLGPDPDERPRWRAEHGTGVELVVDPPAPDAGVLARARLVATAPGAHTVRLIHEPADGAPHVDTRTLVSIDWTIRHFASPVVPQDDVETWRTGAADAVVVRAPALRVLPGAGPPVAGVPADHFGTIADGVVPLAPGRWRIRTRSDDGIRVRLDGVVVIDDWTWHAPRTHEHVFEVTAPRDVALHVEHFERDGLATLELDLEVVE